GGGCPLRRGDHRIRPVPRLGHARQRPHPHRRDDAPDRPAHCPAGPRPARTRPARADAGGDRPGGQPGDADPGPPPPARARRRGRARVVGPARLTALAHYGRPRHFTGAGAVVLFGGGVRRGFVYGETSDEPPFGTVRDPVTIPNLHASLYRAMGIPADLSYEV